MLRYDSLLNKVLWSLLLKGKGVHNMSTQVFQSKRFYGVAVAALMVLSGCGEKKSASSNSAGSSSADGATVLCTIAGKPVITAAQFEQYFNQFVAQNPRIQGMIQFFPNAKQEIFKTMANEEIVAYWAEQNNITQDAEYQRELEQAIQMVKRGLAAKNFQDKHIGKVSVSDSEMKDYYEAHKNPDLIVSPGGVKAVGVEFATKALAQAFLDKAKVNPKNFASVAAADKQKVREFAPINSFSFDVDKNVKDKVSDLKTFPSVILVQGADNKFWVVAALSKEETKYRTMDEVRDGIKSVIERDKLAKIWTDKLDDLRKKYDIVENAEFFEAAKPEAGAMPLSQEDLASLAQQVTAQSAEAQVTA